MAQTPQGSTAWILRLLVDDDLALHSHVAEAAKHATLERIAARGLRDEFNRNRLGLGQLPAILGRCEDQAGRAIGRCAVGIGVDFESVIVIRRRDAQLDLGSLLDMDWRRREIVFLRRHIDDLSILILWGWLLLTRESAD